MATAATGEPVWFDGAGVRMAADRWTGAGSGSPRGTVLLLHGGGQTRHSWFRTAEALASAGWTAIALDARGHGDSGWSSDGDYSIDALVADVAAVAEQLGERPVLVGASMGGMTSLVGQGERGDLARALVLVDIVPRVEPVGVKRIMDFMARSPDGFASLIDVVAAVHAYNPHRKRQPTPDGVRKNLRRGEDGRWYWHWDPAFLRIGDEPRREADEERTRKAAGRVRIPTMVIRGEQSDVVSAEGVAELRSLIPDAELVNVPATGHMVAGDDNDVFSRLVIDFLDRLDSGRGVVLRQPAADVLDTTPLGDYVRWLAYERGLHFGDYDALWRWSVDNLEQFWASVWEFFGIGGDYDAVLGSREMPGARWFPGARLNYAEHMLGGPEDAERPAVVARSQTRDPIELTFGELADRVARARAGLVRLRVRRGDRVVGYLPNIPEALVAMLATASLGATWASCEPEFGARSVVDRFAQVEPVVLIAVAGYTFGPKDIDKTDDLAAIRAGLPTLRHVVGVPYGRHTVDDSVAWDDLLSEHEPLSFEQVPFDHPLHILFSSGTTGLPKAIVHGHGGILLEQLKSYAFHYDTRPGDRVLWFTTTAWTMWNILVSGLLRRATVVLVDGNPLYPDLGAQWRLAADVGATYMGTSPAYAMACRREDLHPGTEYDLSALRTLGITGAPLPDEGFAWAFEQFGDRIMVNSMSGGTDICSAFVGGNPWLPVYRGELPGPCLGVDATSYDPAGREVVGELGELVIRTPMPSMPVRFWNDSDGERYRSSYFDMYPGQWRHGDWVVLTVRHSYVVSGRSDATLNRGGVRLGTAEFYAVVEELPEIADSLVVHLEDAAGGPGELLLFLALRDGSSLDNRLRELIRTALRTHLSPRHVPDVMHLVPAVPRTLTGKKLEAPIKQILQGRSPEEVISEDAVSNYAAIPAFAAWRNSSAWR